MTVHPLSIRTMLIAALLLAAGTVAQAANDAPTPDTRDRAVAAFNAGDYTTARSAFAALADDGDPEAQFFLGIMRLRGLDGPANIPAARAWLKRAADAGHAAAQFQLGEMYRNGAGAPAPDRAAAATWYLRAAEAGWFGAQIAIAGMYAAGEGIPQDRIEALKWYDIAAEMGLDPYTADRDALKAAMNEVAIGEAARRARAWLGAHRNWDSDAIADTAVTAGE